MPCTCVYAPLSNRRLWCACVCPWCTNLCLYVWICLACVFMHSPATVILEHTLPRPPSHPHCVVVAYAHAHARVSDLLSDCHIAPVRTQIMACMHVTSGLRERATACPDTEISHIQRSHTPAHATPPMHPTMSVARSSSRYETDRSHPQSTTQPQPRIQELTRTMCCPTLLNDAKQVACRQQQTTRST
jgi:hypothetical protein